MNNQSTNQNTNQNNIETQTSDFFNQNDQKLVWKTLSEKKLLDTVVFEVTSQLNQATNGTQGNYIVLNASDWVTVIPKLNDNFLMVKQWRHGEKALSIEFPGGVVDKGEEPEKAAIRELEEETGYKTQKLIHLGSVNPNPALFSNHFHVFLAEELVPTGKQNLDSDEFINFMEIPIETVINKMGTKEFPHALMGSALSMYLKYDFMKKKDGLK